MTELVEGPGEEVSYAEKFKDFIKNYRDETGRFKYIDRLHRMINFDLQSLTVEFSDIYRYDPELADALIEDPITVLREAGEALYDLVALEDPDYARKKRKFIVRVQGLYDTVKIREVRSHLVGKLIQVEGIVTRMHPVRSKLVKAVFRHEKCGGEFEWPPGDEAIEDTIEKPTICPVCGEGGGKFILVKEKSKYVDWQKITLQERPEDVPGGQMPRSIEVHLTDDLVDAARPGDRVTIVGIPRLEKTAGAKSPLFEVFLEANSLRVSDKALEEITITREDEERIKQLARDPWVRERIIASIAPSIYGHWDLKEAIALLLFGGVPKVMSDGTRIRGDIHVLFVGDPGVAKSQLLQSAARIAPRAVYTSGKGSTAAGLTAAVVRDPKTGEFYLEAGALVLADGGVAIIDEIDKMRPEDRTAIHEAMEQQVISISKAGIVARLNARASVLAAGNPKLGIYLENKTFAENVNLPPTIISRFDLIFVVKDRVGRERDRRLARYILEAHSNIERFKPEIEPTLLKKYIIYARRYVRPRLSEQAKRLIEDFFVEMRSMAQRSTKENEPPPIPITARQLEAIIRISEAHAKMALKDTVTTEDASEAIRITLAFLTSVGMTEEGEIDASIIMTGKSTHQIRLFDIVMDTIKKLSMDGRCVKLDDIVDHVTRNHNIPKTKVRDIVVRMQREGYIYEPRSGCYRPVE